MDESDIEMELDSSGAGEEIVKKLTRRKTLVSPWKDVHEFKTVYSWIYGEKATNETKRLACRQMTVWKIRRMNLTPASVLGTLVILETQLKDAEMGPSTTAEQIKDLQIQYSSAFTRFFNYMSSIMQTENMRTMYETAKKLNLRSFVVDLRHICAHGQVMPSIEVLRSTSKYCLKWLEDFYWKSQSECMQNVDIRNIRRHDRTQFEKNVLQFFHFYDGTLECLLKGEKKISKKYVKGDKFLAINAYMEKKGILDASSLLNEIVKDLGKLVAVKHNTMDLSDVYTAALLQMRFFFKLTESQTETNEQLETLILHTRGLFRMLAMHGMIEDLFHNLLAVIENKNEETQKRKAASFWANQLVLGFIAFRRCKELYKIEKETNPYQNLDLHSLNSDKTSKKVLQFYIRLGINVKRTLIFGDTVRRPWVWTFDREFLEERLRYANEYSIEILKNVLYLVDPQLADAEINTLRDLFDLKLSNELSKDCNKVKIDDAADIDKVYTAEDLVKLFGSSSGDCITKDAEEGAFAGVKKYGVWSTAPECQDWYAYPIGKLIWE